MAELKRKKSSHRSDRPSKRVAIEERHDAATVTVTTAPNSDEWIPVIEEASTPGITIPGSIPFTPYTKPRSKSARSARGAQSSSILNSELLLHSSAHPKIDYLGGEREVSTSEKLLRHYVGVYDPQSGEVQVVEARKVVLRAVVRDAREHAEEKERPFRTNQEMRQELTRTFGTKKARKAIASLTENAISPRKGPNSNGTGGPSLSDPVNAALLESMNVSAAGTATREQLQAASEESKPRPKANLQAETPEDVYPVEVLIGTDTLKIIMVKEWEDAVRALEPVTTKSRFVSQRLNKVAASGDIKKLKILRYLLLLLDFLFALKPAGKGSRKLPERDDLRKATNVQDFLIDTVRKRFADGPILSRWHVDNLITHIVALTLLIDNFEVDIYDIKEDLKLETKQVSQYYHEIGCRVAPLTDADRKRLRITSKAEAAVHRMARLRIPLDFPKPKLGRRR